MSSRRFVAAGFTLLLVLSIGGMAFLRFRRALTNFIEEVGPRYTGSYAGTPPGAGDSFKVVSWNIKFGTEVDTAIAELQQVEELQDAAVLLLQEMDEEGVEQIAKTLGYNYVYYPASIHTRHGRDFGNAVLSKWPILETVKVVLPHASPTNRQRRVAVGALLDLGGKQMTVYSVHTETPFLAGSKRRDQFSYLGEKIAGETPTCTVVGGDFNTMTARSVATLDEMMAAAGLLPVATTREPTMKLGMLGFTLDHLYSTGATPASTGTWSETAASDHFPIWAVLNPCP